MKKSYEIRNNANEVVMTFFWYNSCTPEEIIPLFENYVFENIIYILLLMKESKQTCDDISSFETLEYIEENITYLEPCVLKTAEKQALFDEGIISAIRTELIRDDINKANWTTVATLASQALISLKIDNNLTADEYIQTHVDLSFSSASSSSGKSSFI